MPIYEYACQKCKAHIEIMQKHTDKPLVRCKKCGGRLEKQWSTTGVQFKGTGWYVTDYAGKKAEKKESETKGEPAKADNKAATTADPKAGGEAPKANTPTPPKGAGGD